MRHHNIWKRIAECLLFMNLITAAFAGPSIAPLDQTALPKSLMGIGIQESSPPPAASLEGGAPASAPNGSVTQSAPDAAGGTGAGGKAAAGPGVAAGNGSPSDKKLTVGPGAQLFNGGSLTLLADPGNRQNLSLILEAADQTLVVVDGGWKDDSGHLMNTLRERGGHVSAWFITHPHNDHAGALVSILNDPNSRITIDHVYYSFADQAWYEQKDSHRAEFVTELKEALSKLPPERLHGNLSKGQVIETGPVRAVVMNDPYLLDATSFNNSSVVYKFYLNDISILVLGDLGPEGGSRLLSEYPDGGLKSDIVQMSHHGQYGVNREVYASINPKIALWPCPLWLWNNDSGAGVNSGSFKTLETRAWMEELGVSANYCVKDGDQIIR